ncbi:mannitol-1-phosphate 5-dehydrogenase [Pectinatus frisingensis]|uniref:mannitol-1-phosphate 5-dehydrogenase n=1 Tax=Pectinatus frisingensis TaxID=865 RepID=UPI0018C60F54|nr:mannitol-1-phosphate 5-dehydrogenase [Pectinatus frisingensis]
MLAVHFGAGNIGRGFIGQMLFASGYEICFIDVNQHVIDDINSLKQYYIEIVGDAPKRLFIKNISAQNSNDKIAVIDKILHADIITTALGPNILKYIAPVIAAGLSKRIAAQTPPINIIACENMKKGSSVLKGLVCKYLSAKECLVLPQYAGFPDAAVDRIVPLQKNNEKLLVQTEEFFEWDVDETTVVGIKPPVKGITYVKNLQAYIERKLFAVNAAHATIAYLGYAKGINCINQALEDDIIKNTVKTLLNEAGVLLNRKYKFNLEEYKTYARTVLNRFSSKYISDDVIRVGRAPIRKLAADDRLVSPAIQLSEDNCIADGYATAIAAALCFDYKEDTEAQILQADIKNNGVADALFKYTTIKADTKLGKNILKKYHKLKK